MKLFKGQNRPIHFKVWKGHWYDFRFHIVTNLGSTGSVCFLLTLGLKTFFCQLWTHTRWSLTSGNLLRSLKKAHAFGKDLQYFFLRHLEALPVLVHLFLFFHLFWHTCSMWKFCGQGSNPHQSTDNARSLTCWGTREFLVHSIVSFWTHDRKFQTCIKVERML